MSRCSSFPPAGYRVSRERYEELIDFIKVLKEKLRKERKKKGKEMMMREKRKKISEEEMQICDFVKTDFELKGEEDEFSNEKRRRRRRRDSETESLNQFEFEGSNTSDLISSITEEEETSSYDSTGNNNNKTMKTTMRKRQLSTSSEEIEYKHLKLEKLFPPLLLDAAAALPPVNLDWLYPDTTKTKTSKEDDDRRRAEKRQRRSESISCSRSWTGPRAQYLHGVDIFALPFVLPF